MSNFRTNPVPQLREIASANLQDLNIEQISRLDIATPQELSYVTESAMRQEPPNLEVATFVAGLCVSRISRLNFGNVGEKDMLMSAASRALPVLENAAWISASTHIAA